MDRGIDTVHFSQSLNQPMGMNKKKILEYMTSFTHLNNATALTPECLSTHCLLEKGFWEMQCAYVHRNWPFQWLRLQNNLQAW